MQVTEELVPAGVWSVDTTHSSVRFEVEHMGISPFSARFTDVNAALDRRNGEVELHGRVRVASVDVEDEILLAHLMAPDFFDTERYPEIGFRSTAISGSGDDLIVAGELTIKGTTRTIEALLTAILSSSSTRGGVASLVPTSPTKSHEVRSSCGRALGMILISTPRTTATATATPMCSRTIDGRLA